MANPNPSPETRFKPGQSGNPEGQKPLPEDIKKARKMNKVEMARILNKYSFLPLEEIKRIASDPATPAIEVAVIKMLGEAIRKGDEKKIGFIFDRLVGPVKTRVSVDGDIDGNPLLIAPLTVEDRLRILEKWKGQE